MKWYYVAYNKMDDGQKQMVHDHLLTKQMTMNDLHKWMFQVREDGVVTRRKGMHKATKEYERELDALLKPQGPRPSKDQPIVFGSGTRFTFSRN